MYEVRFTTRSVSVRVWFVLLALVAYLLSGCASMGKSKEAAGRAVDVFHSQLDSESYSEMYAQADEDFKKGSSQEVVEKLLRAVHQKLGKVEAAHEASWVVNTSADGPFVTLTYNTDFAEGKATEQFVWHIKDGRAALYNYNINSADLITR